MRGLLFVLLAATVLGATSHVSAESGIHISGIPDAFVEDLTLTNIFITYTGGGTRDDAAREVPEMVNGYPEPSHFGVIPAWGLWVRHARNVSFDRIEFRTARPDFRPSLMLDDVDGATFSQIRSPAAPGVPILRLKRVTGLIVDAAAGLSDVRRPDLILDEEL